MKFYINFNKFSLKGSNSNMKTYLNDIFLETSLNNKLNVSVFSEFMKISLFMGKRIYKYFNKDRDKFFNYSNFEKFFSQILSCDIKNIMKLIFGIIDIKNENKIFINDLKIILFYIFQDFNEEKSKIDENEIFDEIHRLLVPLQSTGKLYLSFFDFYHFSKNINSDLFFICYTFLCKIKIRFENVLRFYQSDNEIIEVNTEISSKMILNPTERIKYFIGEENFNYFFENEIEDYGDLDLINDDINIISKHCSPIISFKNKFIDESEIEIFQLDKDRKLSSNMSISSSQSTQSSFKISKNEKNEKPIELISIQKPYFYKLDSVSFTLIKMNYKCYDDQIFYFDPSTNNFTGMNYLKYFHIPMTFFSKDFIPQVTTYKNKKYFSIKVASSSIEKEYTFFFDIFEQLQNFINNLKQILKINEISKKYLFENVCAKSKYANIKVVRDKINNEKYLIKSYSKNKLLYNTNLHEFYLNEQQILKVCNHKNIVKFIEKFEDSENYYMVMEYLEQGNLAEFIYKQTSFLNENKILKIITSICEGLKYLHDLNIVHRDLKMENICYDKNYNIKIIDFGFSIVLTSEDKASECCGTINYMAPEILSEKPYSNNVDVWSFGVLLYYLNYGDFPFNDETNDTKIQNILLGKYNHLHHNNYNVFRSKQIKNLISNCLKPNNNYRYNIKDVLSYIYEFKNR